MKANLLRRVLAAKAILFVGLAIIIALALGMTSTAQAAPGDPFLLGRVNSALDRISQLVGLPAGPVLRIDNNSTATGATALDLQVEPGKPPMTVSSSAKVNLLNADQIDGLDQSAFLRTNGKAADSDKLDGKDSSQFLSTTPYQNTERNTVPKGTANGTVFKACDNGDIVLGGGVSLGDPSAQLLESSKADVVPNAWKARVKTGDKDVAVTVEVYCWDKALPVHL